MSLRSRLCYWSLATDVLLAVAAYELALVVFSLIHHYEVRLATESLDWGLPVGVIAIVLTFLWLGLYKLEAYVSRPLHLMTLAKGALVALVITAFFAFTFKAPLVTDSRLTVFTTFAIFFVLAAVVRIGLLDRVYVDDARSRRGGSLVIGAAADSSVVASRCRELRGFAPVAALEPLDKRRNGYAAEAALLQALAGAEPAPRQVFLDGASLSHKATFDLIAAARARGAEVYVTGRLVSPLDTTRLLFRLFETPVMRVRREPAAGDRIPAVKRAFDLVASAGALALLAPACAVISVLIKRGSPGPVFYRQQRVGLRGRTFEFLKFRSMAVGNDAGEHRDVTCRFIEFGDGAAAGLDCTDEWGRPVYKLAEDERVTRIGRFLRKYSLDELPQFWNVLKGDMSVVGPRPALEYEVAAYKPWHRRRLEVAPGVSGLWQVSGRSRVGFDEMVFQDIIYAYNQSLLTDVSLCLRTVPAMIVGRGAV
ncbi:MAG: exopolysaccharide biosynthesis polyprenyl glycosylphosphotransferase [Actinobacteria bacterium]|nr:exopolysaccharide biosynthesis polyprenyl glycosylphosphotransferase [Actinomycetota bacterium]